MGKIDGAARAKIIQSKCTDPASKSSCEGYVDQCISQRNKIGSDKGDYLLTTKAGKEISIKSFRTCTLLAPRIASIHGASAGQKVAQKKPTVDKDLPPSKGTTSRRSLERLSETGGLHSPSINNADDMLSALSMSSTTDPIEIAIKIMAREIIIQGNKPNLSCIIKPTFGSPNYIGKNDECIFMLKVLKLAKPKIVKYFKARKEFFKRLDHLQSNPLGTLDGSSFSYSGSGPSGSFSYNFIDAKTCRAAAQADKSFEKTKQSIAKQLFLLRTQLHTGVKRLFQKEKGMFDL
jgi:hypothetical protein